MASKRGLSSIVGVTDVAFVMEAFQSLNSCILSLCFEVTVRSGVPDLMVIANAFTLNDATAERVVLASFRSSLRQLNCQTMESAIISCLYRLDARLAQHELSLEQPK